MATWQKIREPPKTKEQLRQMLRQAVQNTQPEKKPKARKDQGKAPFVRLLRVL
jgi:hypothetical protein